MRLFEAWLLLEHLYATWRGLESRGVRLVVVRTRQCSVP